MNKTKHTPGKWQPVYIMGTCIGVGVGEENEVREIICNSVLPDSDDDYEKDKDRIIADMELIAQAPSLLTEVETLRPDNERMRDENSALAARIKEVSDFSKQKIDEYWLTRGQLSAYEVENQRMREALEKIVQYPDLKHGADGKDYDPDEVVNELVSIAKEALTIKK